jgi:MFS family permease
VELVGRARDEGGREVPSRPAAEPRRRWYALTVVSSAMRIPAMRRVLIAFTLFRVAEMATWVALLVWAFDRGGATATGLIAVVQLIPATLVAPFGSAMADRLARPVALRLGYGIQAATNLLAAGVLFLDAGFWVVAAAAAAAASAMTLTRPVHHALLPEIARTPDELTAGNTASTAVEGVADFVGPALAGGMLVVTSAAWVFVAMAVAGLVSVAATRKVTAVQLVATTAADSYWSDAVEGMRVVVRDPAAGVLTAMVTGQFVLLGLLDILAVVLALELLGTGPAGPGLLTSALGVGALVGAAVAVSLIGRHRLTPAVGIGILATSLPVAVVAWSRSFPAALLLLAVSGAGKAYFDVAARTLLQRSISPRVLARIFGVQEALLMGGTALGAAAVPLLVAFLGATGAFVAAGVLLPVVGLLGWSRMRRLDAVATVPGPTLDLLRGIPMFAVLPQPQLEQLALAVEPLPPVAAGTTVIAQGEPGDRYYVVVRGTVEVARDGQAIATLGPGEGFGEIALLRDVPRTASVRAVDELELVALAREPFLLAITGSAASLRSGTATVEDRLAGPTDVDPVG